MVTEPFNCNLEIKIHYINKDDKTKLHDIKNWPDHSWAFTIWKDPQNIFINQKTPDEWLPFVILLETCKKVILQNLVDDIIPAPNKENQKDWSKGPLFPLYFTSLPWRVAAFSWAFKNAGKLSLLDLSIPSNLIEVAFGDPSLYPETILGLGFHLVRKEPLPLAIDIFPYQMQELLHALNCKYMQSFSLKLFTNINELPLLYRGWPLTCKVITIPESNTIYLNENFEIEAPFLLLEEYHKKLQLQGLVLDGNPFDENDPIRRIDPPPEYYQLGHSYMTSSAMEEYIQIFNYSNVRACEWAAENFSLAISLIENAEIYERDFVKKIIKMLPLSLNKK